MAVADGAESARVRLRYGETFHTALQPMGPATVLCAGLRFVSRHQERQGVGSNRRDRKLYGKGLAAALGRRNGSGHYRDRDRPEGAVDGRDGSLGGRSAGGAIASDELQGNDV